MLCFDKKVKSNKISSSPGLCGPHHHPDGRFDKHLKFISRQYIRKQREKSLACFHKLMRKKT
jgi:hypothetical protein